MRKPGEARFSREESHNVPHEANSRTLHWHGVTLKVNTLPAYQSEIPLSANLVSLRFASLGMTVRCGKKDRHPNDCGDGVGAVAVIGSG